MSETPVEPSFNLFEVIVLTIINIGALAAVWKWIIPEIRKNIVLAVRGEV